MPKDAAARVKDENRGLDPDRVALKDNAMLHDQFVFLRGTCRMFYEDLNPSDLPDSPLIWCCGDLHLQNFGTYKGDNRLTYFDLNDFDEACLAPASWELVRFLTSVIVGGKSLEMDSPTRKLMMQSFLDGYRTALQLGKARWLERATAQGVIKNLLSQLKKRTRKKFLASRTTTVKGKRKLVIDDKKTLPLQKGQLSMLREFMATFAATQTNPHFYRLLDAARRIAGTGSLGLERYVLLVEGRGSPNENFLLDFKHEPGSAVVAAKQLPQPKWKSEAVRVASIQNNVQAVSPALLHAEEFNGRSFLLHELMPSNDRLDITKWRQNIASSQQAVRIMGEIVAWGNVRSSGRRGSASAEEVIAFGHETKWVRQLMGCAAECARQTEAQWKEFVKASA